MTTIAYRNGIIAADTGAWTNDTVCARVDKVRRVGDVYVGGAGNLDAMEDMCLWLARGAERDDRPEFAEGVSLDAFTVDAAGTLIYYGPRLVPSRLECDFYACGSGSLVALGALAAGATAERAVEIACEMDSHTSAPVRLWKVKALSKRERSR